MAFKVSSRVTRHKTRITAFSVFPVHRHFFWSEPGPTKCFSRITKHEITKHGLSVFHYPLSFSPPLPLGLRKTKLEIRLSRNMALTASCLGATAVPLAWVFKSRNTAFSVFLVHWPPDISSGVNQAPPNAFHETRDTKHESRPFCFSLTALKKHETRLSRTMALTQADLEPAVPLAWVFGSRNMRHETRITAFTVSSGQAVEPGRRTSVRPRERGSPLP